MFHQAAATAITVAFYKVLAIGILLRDVFATRT